MQLFPTFGAVSVLHGRKRLIKRQSAAKATEIREMGPRNSSHNSMRSQSAASPPTLFACISSNYSAQKALPPPSHSANSAACRLASSRRRPAAALRPGAPPPPRRSQVFSTPNHSIQCMFIHLKLHGGGQAGSCASTKTGKREADASGQTCLSNCSSCAVPT